LYDPLTGAANGTGRVPFAFANCPGLTATSGPQFESCNYIPANRINPIAKNFLSKLVAPTLPGFTNNFFATNRYDSDYNKYDGKITWTPSARVIINGGHQSDLPGTYLGFDGAQPFTRHHLHVVAHDGDGRGVRVHTHRHAGTAAH
jgi:hypothetical protein